MVESHVLGLLGSDGCDRGGGSGVPLLVRLIHTGTTDPQLRLEAVAALGALRGEGVFETLLDVLADPQPPVRAAALRGLAAVDREGFVTVLAGLDPDPHWSVRAAMADVLGGLPLENALPRLQGMLEDTDQRVVPAVVRALVALKADEAAKIALERLTAEDAVVRMASADAVGALKPPNGATALGEAYRLGLRDQTYVARAAALAALARYGASTPPVTDVLTEALADRDWAVRVRAAALLGELDPALDVNARIRPAPSRQPREFYESSAVLTPPVSTQAYIETDRGLIHIEMAMLDAPLTVDNFIRLARAGFFDGVTFHRVVPDFVAQAGDPRGDGEGGPGYTIRDEINQRPYLRGTIGMALDWEDTGGSQYFLTHSPQPHLDGRYTVFGQVMSGFDVLDRIEPRDKILRVRVWDGKTMVGQ
jgi:cyclophilin family peptidyl-prolyl cis-trans isomerase